MKTRERVIEAQRTIVNQLMALEKEIGRLYGRYANALPAHAELFRAMACDEERHAAYLASLQASVFDRGFILHHLGTVERERATIVDRMVISAHQRIDRPALTVEEAFIHALRIESSLCEADFYAIVSTDAPGIGHVLERLAGENKRHADLLRAAHEQHQLSIRK